MNKAAELLRLAAETIEARGSKTDTIEKKKNQRQK